MQLPAAHPTAPIDAGERPFESQEHEHLENDFFQYSNFLFVKQRVESCGTGSNRRLGAIYYSCSPCAALRELDKTAMNTFNVGF
jgi:hypothetical protein